MLAFLSILCSLQGIFEISKLITVSRIPKAGRVLTCFGGEVNTQCSDGVVGRVVIELSDKEVVILHPQWELLHV